jgi:hypothetical protein
MIEGAQSPSELPSTSTSASVSTAATSGTVQRRLPNPGDEDRNRRLPSSSSANGKTPPTSSSFVVGDNEQEDDYEKEEEGLSAEAPRGSGPAAAAAAAASTPGGAEFQPPRRGRATFEALEIAGGDDDEGHDQELHRTEYELEHQHQQEEEVRRLLQSSSADEDDPRPADENRASSARPAAHYDDARNQTNGASDQKFPSLPGRALHAVARILLPDERAERPIRVGNATIFAPSLHLRTGWGVVGPHWFGPLIVAAIAAFSGHFFARQASRTVGPVTALTCAAFTAATLVLLANVALRDPGFVGTLRYQRNQRPEAGDDPGSSSAEEPSGPDPPGSPQPQPRQRGRLPRRRRGERRCDYCQATQPRDGAHCLDCGVCVAGYDHHCVWMGTCIGASNAKQFVRFNLCWLAFLGYAVVWVSLVGPKVF